MAHLRLAVMSDLHVDEVENDDTRMFVEPSLSRHGQFPMSDLDHLISSESISADYLVLPGDTANKANAQGLHYGWRRAHSAAKAMGARLIATSGNHDVVTREPSVDRSEMLKNLVPSFPTGDSTLDSDYWANGWCVIEKDDHRLLVLDSTADFPDFPSDDNELDEYLRAIDRGGLRESAERELENYLQKADEKLNIALLHHHPIEHQLRAHLQDSHGPMRRGGELISLLTNAHRAGRWLVIHGHKHVPQLASATSVSMNGPIVLCAGSLGAKLWNAIDTVARNQFHIVDVQVGAAGLSLSGSVESYTWGFGYGWYRSPRLGSGLPPRAGFGSVTSPRQLVTQIDALVPRSPGSFKHYPELVQAIPELPFMMPADEEILEEIVSDVGLSFLRSASGKIASIAREVPSV